MKELLNSLSSDNLVLLCVIMGIVALFLAIAISIEIYNNNKRYQKLLEKENNKEKKLSDTHVLNIKSSEGIKYVEEDSELEKTKAKMELASLREKLKREEEEKQNKINIEINKNSSKDEENIEVIDMNDDNNDIEKTIEIVPIKKEEINNKIVENNLKSDKKVVETENETIKVIVPPVKEVPVKEKEIEKKEEIIVEPLIEKEEIINSTFEEKKDEKEITEDQDDFINEIEEEPIEENIDTIPPKVDEIVEEQVNNDSIQEEIVEEVEDSKPNEEEIVENVTFDEDTSSDGSGEDKKFENLIKERGRLLKESVSDTSSKKSKSLNLDIDKYLSHDIILKPKTTKKIDAVKVTTPPTEPIVEPLPSIEPEIIDNSIIDDNEVESIDDLLNDQLTLNEIEEIEKEKEPLIKHNATVETTPPTSSPAIDFSRIQKINENDLDEEEAIISYDELKKAQSFGYTDEEMDNYMDEKDAIISIQELENMYKESNDISNKSEKVEEIKEFDVVEEMDTLPPQIEIPQNIEELFDFNKPLDEIIKEEKPSKRSRDIPLYENTDYDKDLLLEQTANLEKLNEEIKKTNEFLKTLKDLKKNLE